MKNNIGTLPEFINHPDPSIYLTGKYVCVDLETTNIDYGWSGNPNNKLVFTAWKCSWETAIKYSWGNEFHQQKLIKDIKEADFIVFQNGKFELGWFIRMGIPLESILGYDIMIGHFVLAGNRRWKMNLDSLIEFYEVGNPKNSLAKSYMESGICPSKWPKGWLKDYGIADVSNEVQVFLKQRQILKEKKLLAVLYNRCILTPVLTEIELNGMYLDKLAVENEYEKQKYRQGDLESQITELTDEINIGSPKQVREYLYEVLKFKPVRDWKKKIITTDKGKLPTGEKIVLQLKATNKKQKQFLDLYKEAKKIKSSFSKILTPAQASVNATCLLYAQFNQTIAHNHRVSSTKRPSKLFHSIQLQNPPRKYKSLFTTRKKAWKLVEVDFEGAEFCSAGNLTEDPQIKKDILDPNFDIHTFSANSKYKLNLSSFKKGGATKDQRQESKPTTFRPTYRDKKNDPWDKVFRKRYKILDKVQQQWREEVLKNKKIRMPWGLIFYWPDCEYTSSGYITRTNEIYNYPISCLATSEWISGAIVGLWHRMKSLKMQSFLVNSLHDSVIAEISPDEINLYSKIAKYCFSNGVDNFIEKLYGMKMYILIQAEIIIRNNWNNPICSKCKKEYNKFKDKHKCLL